MVKLITLLLLSCSLQAQNIIKKYNGINFLLHTPKFSPLNQPLIIFLHGVGEKGGTDTSTIRLLEKYSVPKLSKAGDITELTYNFYVIAPQLLKTYTIWPSSYVKNMIAWAKANLPIDTNRIYLSGLSLGGGGVWTSIQDPVVARQVAAVAVMCGTNTFNGSVTNIPARIYHCANDDIVSVSASDNASAKIKAAGGTAEYTRYAIGGHSGAWINGSNQVHQSYKLSNGNWYIQTPNQFEWLLKFRK